MAAGLARPAHADEETPSSREQKICAELRDAGKFAEAVPHFEAALQVDPGSVELHQNFAQVLRALGRTRDALRHFDEATRLQLQR